jgi:hypothetical protein
MVKLCIENSIVSLSEVCIISTSSQQQFSHLEKKKPSVFIFLPCSPTSDGSAAVIVASEEFVRKHNLESQAVEILGMEMGTDTPTTFGRSCMSLVGLI